MKFYILFFLFLSHSYSQNFIFENPKNSNQLLAVSSDCIYYFENDKILLKKDNLTDTIRIEHFGKLQYRFINSAPFIVNFYKGEIKDEGIISYLEVNYGDLRLKVDGEYLFFEGNINKEYYLNNNKIALSDLQKKYKSIRTQDYELLNEDKIEDAEFVNVFSSFVGGYGFGRVSDMKTNENGDVYLAGHTSGHLMNWYYYIRDPMDKEYYFGGSDNYYIKIDKNNSIKWITFLGSSRPDTNKGDKVTRNGDYDTFIDVKNNIVAISSVSTGTDYNVTSDAYQDTLFQNGEVADRDKMKLDAIITKINNTTGKIEYCSYFGGDDYEYPTDVKIDNNNNIWYLMNTKTRNLFTTENAYQRASAKPDTSKESDIYLLCITPNNQIKYASYISSNRIDRVYECILFGVDLIIGGFSLGDVYPNYELSSKQAAIMASINTNDFTFNWMKKYSYYSFCDILNYDGDKFLALSYVNLNNLSKGDVYRNRSSFTKDLLLGYYDKDGNVIKSTYLDADVYNQIHFTSDSSPVIADVFLGPKQNRICLDEYKNIYTMFPTKNDNYYTSNNAIQKELWKHPWDTIYHFNNYIKVLDSTLKSLRHSTYWAYGLPYGILYNNKCVYMTFESSSIGHLSTRNGYQRLSNGHPGIRGGYISRLLLRPPDVVDTCFVNDFDLTDVDTIDNFVVLENANRTDSTIRLTYNEKFQKGAIFYKYTPNLRNGFVTEYTFVTSLGDHRNHNDGSIFGADGIVFLMTDKIPKKLGFFGGGLAYENLTNALAVEIDLHRNRQSYYNDPNGNHIAVFASKDTIFPNHNGDNLLAENTKIPILKHNLKYKVKIVYSYKKEYLKVFFAQNFDKYEEVISIEEFKIKDVIDLIDDEKIHIGILASTGAAVQQHELHSWSFCSLDDVAYSDIELETSNINLYPNPSDDYLQVDFEERIKSIKIIDILGNECMNINHSNYLNNSNIDISKLQSGIYLAIINGKERFKFIKR